MKLSRTSGVIAVLLTQTSCGQLTADVTQNSSAVSVELQFQQYSEDGSAVFFSRIENSGTSKVCMDERTLHGLTLEFRSTANSNHLLGQVDDVFPEDASEKSEGYAGSMLIELLPDQAVNFSFSIHPLAQPYYVDDNWAYLSDYQKGEKISASLTPIFAPCSYRDVNSALKRQDFFQVRSNTVTMPEDEGMFFASPK
ncbi:hypothetical protein [Ruegeria sp.]|uniref:hypothetical protein n=1 Tax=Ruegeria sp. TaxID=1879320 RepID=UPI003B5CC572